MNPSGLPTDLFATGEARWLEVQVTGAAPQPRVLLTTVPYAMKAADAATLGGLPASAFALAGSTQPATTAALAGSAPDASLPTVTTTGGTSHYIPIFTGTNIIGNSEIYDTGKSVGIGDIPNSSVKLDVDGAMIMRGNMQVTRAGNATVSKAYPSYGFEFYSSAYNSSTRALDNPFFSLQSEPTGNNTSSPSATFNVLFSNNGAAPAETGLSINSSGIINFASGQTFNVSSPGGTTVNGTSTSGTGVQGTSNSGTGVAGTSTSANGVLGYTGGGTLNTAGVLGGAGGPSGFGGIAGVWGDASMHVGVLGTSSQYAGVQGISTSGPGVQAMSTNGVGVQATSTNSTAGQFSTSSSSATVYATNTSSNGGSALYGVSQGSYGIGVYASETGTDGTGVEAFGNGNGVIGDTSGGVLETAGVLGIAGSRTGVSGIAGVWGDAQAHVGVIGSSTQYDGVQGITANQAGVHGIAGASTTGLGFLGTTPALVGVWGDSTGAGSSFQQIAVLGTANDGDAGEFWNSSNGQPTLFAYNYGSGGTIQNPSISGPKPLSDGIFSTLEASTLNGTCGFGSKGDMTCTGQLKSLATTGSGAHTVETYSMQSPENWMEDFGSGTLQNGIATVSIDAAFAETVSSNLDYHVFITPRGDSKGLYVTNATATSFEVHESGGGTSTLGFDYRIVAKRRGFEAQRMADVTEAMRVVHAKTTLLEEQHMKAARQ
jgi:hypothetical protein